MTSPTMFDFEFASPFITIVFVSICVSSTRIKTYREWAPSIIRPVPLRAAFLFFRVDCVDRASDVEGKTP